MTSVFLDTSYIIALETADDINHDLTLKHWQSFIPKLPRLVTTSGASQFLFFNEIIKFQVSLRSRSSLRDAQRERNDGRLLNFTKVGCSHYILCF